MLTSLRDKPVYPLVLWSVSILCVVLMILLGMRAVTSPGWIYVDDYVEYWAAGRLNFTGGNPYDPEQLLPLQLQAGRYFGVPVMMWNPPGMLALVMPFGILPYAISRTLWLLLFFIIGLFCFSRVWWLYGGPPQKVWVGWLLGFFFIPFLDALKTGQTGPLLFLGVVGFLTELRRDRPMRAGAYLALLAVKPHVLYLFGLAVAIWIVDRKQWKVLFGMAAAIAVVTAIAWAVNPWVIHQYLYAIANYPPEDWATPTVGGILRLLFGTDRFWMQFIAPVLGIAWLLFNWKQHRDTWDWIEHSPLLILVSIATAAYGWTSDQTVSLVAILQIGIILSINKWHPRFMKIVGAYILITILMLTIRMNQIFSFWLAPSLLIWYLGSIKIVKEKNAHYPSIIPENERIIPE